MSHGDRVEALPPGFAPLASTANCPVAAMADRDRKFYGLQFHPEVGHTHAGKEIIRRFVREICGCRGGWTPGAIIEQAVTLIRQQVGDARVLSGVSGGVDSSVATALVGKAVGERLTAVFVDTGLMRSDEGAWVEATFRERFGICFATLDASEIFFKNLQGVISPEQKRKIIGETFIRQFEIGCGEGWGAAVSGPGNHLPGCDRIPRPERSACAPDQDPSQCRRAARKDVL